MSRGETCTAAGPPPRPVTRPLLVRFVSIVGASASFYLLLSTVPEYARAAGASAGTAGLTTTALTLSSVAAYLAAPGLIARHGYRPVLAAGLAALGARCCWPPRPASGSSWPCASSAASASRSPVSRATR
jgi:MFS family permease